MLVAKASSRDGPQREGAQALITREIAEAAGRVQAYQKLTVTSLKHQLGSRKWEATGCVFTGQEKFSWTLAAAPLNLVPANGRAGRPPREPSEHQGDDAT